MKTTQFWTPGLSSFGSAANAAHPREVILIERLPRTWHGKVDRGRLRELAAHHGARQPPGIGPTGSGLAHDALA